MPSSRQASPSRRCRALAIATSGTHSTGTQTWYSSQASPTHTQWGGEAADLLNFAGNARGKCARISASGFAPTHRAPWLARPMQSPPLAPSHQRPSSPPTRPISPPAPCVEWCPYHTQIWETKCYFRVCSGCQECFIAPPPPAHPPLPPNSPPLQPSPPLSPPPPPAGPPLLPGCACSNECIDSQFAEDGICDDGGLGSDYARCALGTDCEDCSRLLRCAWPPLPPPTPPPLLPGCQCSNECRGQLSYAEDGNCDDGSLGSDYSSCALGTDCEDCGRMAHCAWPLSPPPPLAPAPPAPPLPSPPPPSPPPSVPPPPSSPPLQPPMPPLAPSMPPPCLPPPPPGAPPQSPLPPKHPPPFLPPMTPPPLPMLPPPSPPPPTPPPPSLPQPLKPPPSPPPPSLPPPVPPPFTPPQPCSPPPSPSPRSPPSPYPPPGWPPRPPYPPNLPPMSPEPRLPPQPPCPPPPQPPPPFPPPPPSPNPPEPSPPEPSPPPPPIPSMPPPTPPMPPPIPPLVPPVDPPSPTHPPWPMQPPQAPPQPSAPLPPSLPPAQPGESYHGFRVSFGVHAGSLTVEDFDEATRANFTAGIVSLLALEASEFVSLTVAPASVLVTTTIDAATLSAAMGFVGILSAQTPASFSSAIGVAIDAIDTSTVMPVTRPWPSPPSLPPSPSPPGPRPMPPATPTPAPPEPLPSLPPTAPDQIGLQLASHAIQSDGSGALKGIPPWAAVIGSLLLVVAAALASWVWACSRRDRTSASCSFLAGCSNRSRTRGRVMQSQERPSEEVILSRAVVTWRRWQVEALQQLARQQQGKAFRAAMPTNHHFAAWRQQWHKTLLLRTSGTVLALGRAFTLWRAQLAKSAARSARRRRLRYLMRLHCLRQRAFACSSPQQVLRWQLRWHAAYGEMHDRETPSYRLAPRLPMTLTPPPQPPVSPSTTTPRLASALASPLAAAERSAPLEASAAPNPHETPHQNRVEPFHDVEESAPTAPTTPPPSEPMPGAGVGSPSPLPAIPSVAALAVGLHRLPPPFHSPATRRALEPILRTNSADSPRTPQLLQRKTKPP